jgi:hypothetical protein
MASISIIGREQQYRRDVLHIDSAYKSRCSVFITRDSDILKHKSQLLDLLEIRCFDPDVGLRDLELFIRAGCPSTGHSATGNTQSTRPAGHGSR